MSYNNPEPECNCTDCPNIKDGECAEFKALNPGWLKMFNEPYNRGHCLWGHETIKKLKESMEVKTE